MHSVQSWPIWGHLALRCWLSQQLPETCFLHFYALRLRAGKLQMMCLS